MVDRGEEEDFISKDLRKTMREIEDQGNNDGAQFIRKEKWMVYGRVSTHGMLGQ